MADDQFKYRAFISYSHADESWAKWLHRRLERYRVPSRLVGSQSAHGVVPRQIGRCFRDQAELSAASHLGEHLQQALQDSQTLIVVCSPRSATSHWVNEEIKYFRGIGRGDHIYALIVDGEPNARDPQQECFPPALLHDDAEQLQEPLAADARTGRDGKTDGFLKLAAGLLGVPFDQLRQREARRRMQRMFILVIASLVITMLTTLLAISAYYARNESQLRRQQANDLINFMLGDLKDRLEPVGRLDVLDAVTAKVISYVGEVDNSQMDEAALAQKVSALVSVADIEGMRSRTPESLRAAQAAVQAARDLQRRQPGGDTEYLLGHALQATVYPLMESGDNEAARSAVDEGLRWAQKALAARPQHMDSIHDAALFRGFSAYLYDQGGDDANALREYQACADQVRTLAKQADAKPEFTRLYSQCRGTAASRMAVVRSPVEATAEFQALIAEEEEALVRRENDMVLLEALLGDIALAADTYQEAGRLDLAESASHRSVALGHRMIERDPANAVWKNHLGIALYSQSELALTRADWTTLEQSSNEEIAVYQELLEKEPRSTKTRQRLMEAYAHRARARLQQRQLAAAIADWEQMLLLGKDDAEPSIQFDCLWARLNIWEQTADTNPQRARAERLAASELLKRLNSPEVMSSPRWVSSLKLRQMQFAYLDGDAADGDRLYAELSKADKKVNPGYAETRRRLCARLLRGRGPYCGKSSEGDIPVQGVSQ